MDFVSPAIYWMNAAVFFVTVVMVISALANCVTRRSDAFGVVGNIPKIGWVAILSGCLIFTGFSFANVLAGVSFLVTSSLITGFLAVASLVASGVYLLDVRPALRDATSGNGSW